MLPIFLGFLFVGISYLVVMFILNYMNHFRKRDRKKNRFLSGVKSFFTSFVDLVEEFTNLKFLTFFLITVAIFVVFSFYPYVSNLNDKAFILEQTNNIELYEEYIDDYSESARKQIEEFQEMQSEMAARATSEQLQFWSLQQDDIGDALTEQIREFNTKIRDAELEINHRKGRIEARSSNKWYFFMED